jgi:hypothetical protein
MISSIHLMITRDTSIRVLEFKNHYFGYPKKIEKRKTGSYNFLRFIFFFEHKQKLET